MSRTHKAGHGLQLATVLCTLLLVTGLALIAVFVNAQGFATEPALTTSQQAEREAATTPTPTPQPLSTASPPPASPAPTPAATGQAVAKPVQLTIASIELTSVLNPTGLDHTGAIQAPAPGPHYNQASWFTGSPKPGQNGPAVIVGHIDGPDQRTSVFFKLSSLRPGNQITITRADHSRITFEVYRLQRYAKNDFPTLAVYGNTDQPELRLITCAGQFDQTTGNYRDNTVAYARILTPN